MPNVLSPRDLVSRPDNMDETVPHTHSCTGNKDNYKVSDELEILPDPT